MNLSSTNNRNEGGAESISKMGAVNVGIYNYFSEGGFGEVLGWLNSIHLFI